MTTYRMDDGIIVDTDKAKRSWDEDLYWDGNNWISRATDSQWDHEMLMLSRKGRYYIWRTSNRQGNMPSAQWLTDKEATAWLLLNEIDVPDDLLNNVEDVSE